MGHVCPSPLPCEFVSGTLVVTPTPRGLHQRAVAELYLRIQEWLSRHPVAHVLFSPGDITLGEDEILQPDLFVYRTASGAPLNDWSDITELLLVIEVSSPRTADYDRQLKRRRYQSAGIAEYWVVDLDARVVERWHPADEAPEVVADELGWQPAPGGPVMVLNVEGLFGELSSPSSPSSPPPSAQAPPRTGRRQSRSRPP